MDWPFALVGQAANSVTLILVLLAFAFVPPVVFLVWIRNSERYGREPWSTVLRVFFFGAFAAVIAAVVLSVLLLLLFSGAGPVYIVLGERFADPELIVLALIIAPFAEELAKLAGVWTARRTIREPEDGLVYGAASGLGFSATENLVYALVFFETLGLGGSVALIVFRSISSTFLHASSTGVSGYGLARRILWGRIWVGYYLVAVAMHSVFNFLASFGELYRTSLGDTAGLLGVATAIVFAVVSMTIVRTKIREGRGRYHWAR